jgi:hypothetical protein
MRWETENIFDFLYSFILFLDFLSCTEITIDREIYINKFIFMMNDVYENQKKSLYFYEFHSASSIDSFYKTILYPRLSI